MENGFFDPCKSQYDVTSLRTDKDKVILVQNIDGSSSFSKTRDTFSQKYKAPTQIASCAPQSPLSVKRDQRSPLSKHLPCGKVEIFVHCDELPKMDAFSSSDPFCVLYVQRYGQWTEYARTECIPNCHKPKFTESFILDANSQEHQHLKFSIFDSENLTSKDLHKHQLIGSIETELNNLITLESPSDGLSLQFQALKSKRGKIYLTVEELDEEALKTNIKLCFSALKLSKKGLNIFGKCDAYFELERKLNDSRYHPVYRSEVIFRNTEPRWKPFEISLQKLCNGKKDADILITLFNFNTKGDHSYIGNAKMSFSSMTRRIGDVKTLPLRKGQWPRSISITSKGGSNEATTSKAMIRILRFVPEEYFSLADYVKGGCPINFVAAIDFSSSNGDMQEDTSLHFSSESKKSIYEEALHGIGSWLSYYDPRRYYKLYGFAGQLNGDETSFPCFSLTRDGLKDLFAGGKNAIEELVYLYRSHLKCITLSGPTLFTPVLNRIRKDIIFQITQDCQQFTLALIVTDGIANDMKEFFEALITCANQPISIVVACIGPLRMETEHYFNILDDRIIKKCGRTIIYPLAFSDENLHLPLQSIRSTFAKLSKDIVKFFASRGIRPNKPLSSTLHAQGEASVDVSKIIMDPLQISDSENWQNSLKEATSFCPTCGSHTKGSLMPEVIF